jgi:glycosyltransferase involved in cell wall biosynthesis
VPGRILVLNQYYRPGVEATANLLAELCEHLAEAYDVTVFTGAVRDRDDLPHVETVNGVRIIRVRSTALDRSKLFFRALNYLTYLAGTLSAAMRVRRPVLVLCMTDPPIVGDLGVVVSRRHGVPLLVVSEDVFPEIATELGLLTNPLLVTLLRRLVSVYLSRAAHVVAIGETMRQRLITKGASPDRVSVITNWVDTSSIVTTTRRNDWSREHELEDRFVVIHSGNVGHAQNLDNLVYASTYLRDLDDLVAVVVGSGARGSEIHRLVERLQADSVRFLPFQPSTVLSQSLGAAHLHYVGLAKGLSGFVVPSRVYGILAAGRPIVVAADADSETVRLVEEVTCGVVLPPDRPDLLAAVIRDAHDGRLDLEGMGARGRDYVVREADRSVALRRYRELIDSVVLA